MRNVFPSNEVYHLWANQVQESGRNNGDTVSFRTELVFSYGTPIGKIVTNAKGERGYLISKHGYSVTTSSHQSMLRQAVGYETENVFYVEFVECGGRNPRNTDIYSHEGRVQEYTSQIAKLGLKAKRARVEFHRDHYVRQLADIKHELENYCQFFDLAMPYIDVDVLTGELAAAIARDNAANKARKVARRAELEVEADQWRNGQRSGLPWDYPDVLLRRFEDDVETSKGARVPLSHAERLYKLWQRNEVRQGERVGYYSVAKVINGTALQIGCHYITREEAEKFATSMGWV